MKSIAISTRFNIKTTVSKLRSPRWCVRCYFRNKSSQRKATWYELVRRTELVRFLALLNIILLKTCFTTRSLQKMFIITVSLILLIVRKGLTTSYVDKLGMSKILISRTIKLCILCVNSSIFIFFAYTVGKSNIRPLFMKLFIRSCLF